MKAPTPPNSTSAARKCPWNKSNKNQTGEQIVIAAAGKISGKNINDEFVITEKGESTNVDGPPLGGMKSFAEAKALNPQELQT